MKQLDITKIATTVSLSRREKLLRWANLIRKERKGLVLFHNLEHWTKAQLKALLPEGILTASAFTVAADDPVFASLGLGRTAADAMKFFELSRAQLHGFSCDCGGVITNEEMARRIERLAE
jgi:hypothetical protein